MSKKQSVSWRRNRVSRNVVAACALSAGLLAGTSNAQVSGSAAALPTKNVQRSLASHVNGSAGGASISLASTASGYSLSTIYLNHPSSPTNVVPGLGVPFAPGGSSTTAFFRPNMSRNGAHWAIRVDADTGSTDTDSVLILDGALLIQEGTQAPLAPLGETWDLMDDRIALGNSGDVFITVQLEGTPGGNADDDIMAYRSSAGVWSEIAREGDLVDPILPSLAGATWSGLTNTPLLTDTGLLGWRDVGLGGTVGGSSDNEIDFLGSIVLHQENVTIPAGQAGGLMDFWENSDYEDIHVNTDGSIVLLIGDTANPSFTDDDVLALNNTIVLQENQIIPGSGFAEPIDQNGIVYCGLDEGDNWYARGDNDVSEDDWVVRNGVVVARSTGSDPIFTGSLENWDDTSYGPGFFAFDGNALGAYVIGGATDAPATSERILILDDGAGNRTVLCREGDPVDADGNGLFDDDRFFNEFGNDDVLLDDSGSIWFTATLRNGAGSPTDQGFFRLEVDGGPFPSSCNGDGGDQLGCTDCPCGNNSAMGTIGGCLNSATTSSRLLPSGSPSVSLPSGDTADLRFGMSGAPAGAFCILNSGDALAPQGMANPCFGLGSGAQSATFDGLRCAVQNTLRHGGRSADGTGDVGVTNNPWGGEGGPAVGIAQQGAGFVSGQTRYFQVIHRDDPLAVCARGLNTSQAVEVTFTP